jgi:hypothetical protein
VVPVVLVDMVVVVPVVGWEAEQQVLDILTVVLVLSEMVAEQVVVVAVVVEAETVNQV